MYRLKLAPLLICLAVFTASCGESKKEDSAAINDKKAALAKLKNQNAQSDAQIKKLQDELSKLDTAAGDPTKTKLVALSPVTSQAFNHYIELQGRVDAENSAYISPRNGGGQVKQVLVRQGQRVSKGQLLLKLDNAVQSQQVIAARQQAAGIRTQLALAKTISERQQNLWDKGIGTEVQLLQAKTNVTSLENQLSVVAEQVKLAQEQMNLANVYSDVSGVADVVNIRPGEMFTGMTAAGAQIKIVNTSSLKVVSSIPENYLGQVQQGSAVVIEMPDLNKEYNSTVSFVGASIDQINRGFTVEAKLPSGADVKPNQVAVMKIRDYAASNAISIPLKTLQTDQDGKFVMVAVSDNSGLKARKRPVTIGMINGSMIEIKSGLRPGEQLITQGYNGLYEGQSLKTM